MADIQNMIDLYVNYEHYNEANLPNERLPRRIIRDVTNPFEYYSDEEFRKRYRFRKNTTLEIIELIRNDLEKTNNRGQPIPVMMKVLIALRFFATGVFQIVCADLRSVSQSSVSRIVKEVAMLIAQRRQQFICFPDGQEIISNRRMYYEKFRFPGVIGCIDCTHVDITSRGGPIAEVYRNRHGDFSFNVQCISGPQLQMLDIVASWAGSTHDTRIFDNSRVRVRMENEVPHGHVLLGDRGYPCRRYLLTPLANPATVAENRYQRAHIRTRNSVERMFGIWKKKFHCLTSTMAYKTSTLLTIITATAVLYNIGNRRVDNVLEEEEENQDPYVEPEHEVVADNAIGFAMRRAFIQRHFS